jgi:hypothetical protein
VKHFPRIAFVVILVSVLGLNTGFAQSPAPISPAATNDGKTAVVPSLVALTLPAVPAVPNRLSLPALKPPQASSKRWGAAVGLAMAGTGAILLARKEEPHQTTCVPYGACPRPGIVKITGATLVGVGVPLTILKLKR